MRWLYRAGWLPRVVLLAAVTLMATTLVASDQIKGVRKYNPQDETVELFSAVEEGKLEVKLIPKDSTRCRVLITNKTDKPLNVSLPDAFAGVPVLAQIPFQPGGMFPPGMNNMDFANANAGAQTIGIGNRFGNNWGQANRGNQFFNMGGPGNNLLPGLGPNMGPNFAPFNVAPENVAQLRLTSVCLEHGKPDPRPKMAYELRPIESVTDKAELHEVCRMLGRQQLSQQAAQAAAWHLVNGMSWEELAGLKRKIVMGRIVERYFTAQDLAQGKKAVEAATELVNQRSKAAQADSLSMQ
jgi:hypothetical protein